MNNIIPVLYSLDPFIQIFFISLKIHGLILSQGFFLSNFFKWRINPYSHNAIRMRIWAQGSSLFIFSFKFSNFSTIFVPVLFCNFLRIWNSFLLISLASKYLQPNFEVWGVLRSLSTGLIPTVIDGLAVWKCNNWNSLNHSGIKTKDCESNNVLKTIHN